MLMRDIRYLTSQARWSRLALPLQRGAVEARAMAMMPAQRQAPNRVIQERIMAQVRREMSLGDAARTTSGRPQGSLSGRAQAGAITLPHTRQG